MKIYMASLFHRATISIINFKPQVFVTVTQRVSVVGVAGWQVILTGWPPVTVGVVEVGVVDTRYGISQSGEDAER